MESYTAPVKGWMFTMTNETHFKQPRHRPASASNTGAPRRTKPISQPFSIPGLTDRRCLHSRTSILLFLGFAFAHPQGLPTDASRAWCAGQRRLRAKTP